MNSWDVWPVKDSTMDGSMRRLFATLLAFAALGGAQGTRSVCAQSSILQVALTTDEEAAIFDSHLVTPSSSCTDVIPTPGCLDIPGINASPSQPIPQPQLTSPDSAFAPPSVSPLSAGQGALTAQSNVAALMPGGYLDPAAPATMFRLRFDFANDNRFPDRGEYFYAKCGCFRQLGLDAGADGPIGLNTSVDYREVRAYMEYALNPRFSVFTEVAGRFVDYNSLAALPSLGSESGFADMNAGFKYALIAEPDQYLTFQLRTYIPTGNSRDGLGTDHVSIEPSLLYYRQLSDKWLLQGQFTEFSPIGGSNFASDVLQYGVGVGYIAWQGEAITIIPTFETVGWTFLNGRKFHPIAGESSARGDTIVNIKPGVRIGLGDSGPMMMQRHSLYAGFGIPVTDDEFYENLFRIEYRIVF
jgi:hypothetical protein